MTTIKLVYFNLRARGEPVRLVLEAAGKKYEDVRVSFDDWPALKPNTPYGSLPYVEYNGKSYGQSAALACFFAREYGLYGKTGLDGLRIDEVVNLCADLLNDTYKMKFENDETKKAELAKKLWEEITPKYMGHFQRLLKENESSGFFVGSTVTLADIYVYSTLDSLIAEKSDISATFPPEVKKMRSCVEAHPFLKTYLAKRPEVSF